MPEFTGTLRHPIVIEQRNETQNSFGEPAPTWTTFASVWAAVQPLSGAEPFVAEQFAGIVDHRIQVRYLVGVTPKMRINWNGRLFDILAVLNRDERNEQLDILAKEHV